MQQTVERFDAVQLEPNVLKKVCEQMLFTMICLLRHPNSVQGFDPGSMIATMRQLILIMAQQCANESALRAFYQVVKEIKRSARKTWRTKFSALKLCKELPDIFRALCKRTGRFCFANRASESENGLHTEKP
jgi:hypothetical protein